MNQVLYQEVRTQQLYRRISMRQNRNHFGHAMTAAAVVVIGSFIAATAPNSAHAATNIYPVFDRSDTVYVGMARHGSSSLRAFACYDGPNTNDEIWILLGTSGLTQNYTIWADRPGQSNYNTMRANGPGAPGPSSSSDCASSSGSWQPLVHNGFYLDFQGGQATTTFFTAGMSTHSYCWGGADIDLFYVGSGGYMFGGGGDDHFWAYYGTLERLRGDSGEDCIGDSNGTLQFSSTNCGADHDQYGNNFTSTPYLCEQRRAYNHCGI